MSQRFTIVPTQTFWAAAEAVANAAATNPTVDVVEEGSDLCLYFAGDPDVLVAAANNGRRGLACLRIGRSTSAFHVDAEGYEGSAAQLGIFLRAMLRRLRPCKVYDDETGDDLSFRAERFPSRLIGPEPEFHDEEDTSA